MDSTNQSQRYSGITSVFPQKRAADWDVDQAVPIACVLSLWFARRGLAIMCPAIRR
jgi:hypothetical protein